MVKLGNVNIVFVEIEKWDFSAPPLSLWGMEIQISSEKCQYKNSISFERNESPLEFFESLRNKCTGFSSWQSLCQEFRIDREPNDDESNIFTLYLNNDSDNADAASDIEIRIYVAEHEISIDASKLKQFFLQIKGA